ncbi:hypothetical protein [Rhodococcoides fascians]|uniref:hypothetical protein n=1 Tax=Rhodococcoides fascians TaxID=1828 RepID=UPI00055BA231|nr:MULTISPECIES: hypothetical protein [Rhodococcus]OZF01339.1 hypothetical protein CH301_11440 [Rhodococcus sp. 15-1189-1-1a]OZF15509.1 hypothetical protein CH299_11990 [Rhodococcus sp. 14-2686-1-2]
MAIKNGTTVEEICKYIDGNIMPAAVAQWEDLKEQDPEGSQLRWVEGRIDAALQILQPIDDELFDKWLDLRHKQTSRYTS